MVCKTGNSTERNPSRATTAACPRSPSRKSASWCSFLERRDFRADLVAVTQRGKGLARCGRVERSELRHLRTRGGSWRIPCCGRSMTCRNHTTTGCPARFRAPVTGRNFEDSYSPSVRLGSRRLVRAKLSASSSIAMFSFRTKMPSGTCTVIGAKFRNALTLHSTRRSTTPCAN